MCRRDELVLRASTMPAVATLPKQTRSYAAARIRTLLPQQFALGDNPLRKILTTAVIAVLAVPATSAAIAADLIVDEPAVVAPSASDLALYGKLYGGVTLENTLGFGGDDYDLDPGYMLGAAVGVGTGIEGLSVELDVTGSLASYTGYDESLGAVTLMGNVVYTAGVSDMFKLYGGVGLGAVHLSYDNPLDINDADGTAAAGQAFAGVEAAVTENVSLLGEVRYQSAFSDVSITSDAPNTYDVEYSRTALLVGIKISN